SLGLSIAQLPMQVTQDRIRAAHRAGGHSAHGQDLATAEHHPGGDLRPAEIGGQDGSGRRDHRVVPIPASVSTARTRSTFSPSRGVIGLAIVFVVKIPIRYRAVLNAPTPWAGPVLPCTPKTISNSRARRSCSRRRASKSPARAARSIRT